jgi:hypothetical protein
MARTQTVITLLSETTRAVLENYGSDMVRGVLDAQEAPVLPGACEQAGAQIAPSAQAS